MHELLTYSDEIADARANGAPIVALESTVIAQGLPTPFNIETAGAMEDAVRESGAVPAMIGLIEGTIKIGLSRSEIERLGSVNDVAKVGPRDLAYVLRQRNLGATTVAGTFIAADLAGIAVFATGGIGGVHRSAKETFDISADLHELSKHPLAVVSAGAKSILDLPATLEVLESLGVPVIGYQTSSFPAFYVRESELPLTARIEEPLEAAEILATQRALGLRQALLIANPIPEEVALSKEDVEGWIKQALEKANAQSISGKALTPFLLSALSELSDGQSLKANKALLLNNARLAGHIAVAYHDINAA
jgi:pseudouridine-5'-phosphate glycosidase